MVVNIELVTQAIVINKQAAAANKLATIDKLAIAVDIELVVVVVVSTKQVIITRDTLLVGKNTAVIK